MACACIITVAHPEILLYTTIKPQTGNCTEHYKQNLTIMLYSGQFLLKRNQINICPLHITQTINLQNQVVSSRLGGPPLVMKLNSLFTFLTLQLNSIYWFQFKKRSMIVNTKSILAPVQ